jgi:hypothetical protein
MADLNVFTCTATVEEPFERFIEEGKEYARGRIAIHNYKEFYSHPWVVVEGRKVDSVMGLNVGQGVKIIHASLRSSNKSLECLVVKRTLVGGILSPKEEKLSQNYTDVHLFVDDRDGCNILTTEGAGENDINSFTFTGRICTDPQSRIVGRNKNSLSYVSASNFSRKSMPPAFLYVVVEGKEAQRLDGRLSVNSKFSGNALIRTKTKTYQFEYKDTEIDEDASAGGITRYKQVSKVKELEVDQLEVLFLDYRGQLNFIDNIKNPELAERFGEV